MQAWEEALELRTEMESFWRSQAGERYSEVWSLGPARRTGKLSYHATVHMVEATKMSMATPVFVAPDMMDLWMHAQADFPGETIEEEDLSIPAGLVVLPKPWIVKDLQGETFKLSAFSWLRVRVGDDPGVHVSLYQRMRDETDEMKTNLRKLGPLPPLSLLHAMSLSFGENYATQEAWVSALGREVTEEAHVEMVAVVRGIQSFWRLAWQEIGKPYALEASRAVRKRFSRRFKDRPIPLVTVIALRPFREGGKKPYEDGWKEDVQWTHRWMRSGHWRNQWYPSVGLHRAIYIAPTICGPDDKPLVLKDKAYGWTR